jgi:2-hydroxychromene-2-carboxylate isomerase
MSDADIHFYFDPVCPFAWMTSKWVWMVQTQRDHTVDWRFISLRTINAAMDYDSQFPPGYEAGHTAGLKLLRVAARTRAEHGRPAVGPLYEALGARLRRAQAEPARAAAAAQLRCGNRPGRCPVGLARRPPVRPE